MKNILYLPIETVARDLDPSLFLAHHALRRGFAIVVGEKIRHRGDAPIGDARTRHGGVQSLDEAESVAAWFAREGVDGLVLCPLDFGDERSACIVAQRLGVPVFLYATEEPPAQADASLARVSDSYCGNLSMASGLHRRGIEFRFGGIFMPDDPELHRELDAFVRAVAVVKGLRNARIGQIGVRPASFETVAYDEAALVRKFGFPRDILGHLGQTKSERSPAGTKIPNKPSTWSVWLAAC